MELNLKALLPGEVVAAQAGVRVPENASRAGLHGPRA